MNLKFLVDTQLPPKLSHYLNSAGFDSKHTFDYPEGQFLNDKEIIKIITKEDRIIVTKDKDFYDSYMLSKNKINVILINLGNCSNKKLLSSIKRNINKIKAYFKSSSGMIIIEENDLIYY